MVNWNYSGRERICAVFSFVAAGLATYATLLLGGPLFTQAGHRPGRKGKLIMMTTQALRDRYRRINARVLYPRSLPRTGPPRDRRATGPPCRLLLRAGMPRQARRKPAGCVVVGWTR
jgi:hypothetical protein